MAAIEAPPSEADESQGRRDAVVAARRRAALVAAVAGLALVPWFLVAGSLANLGTESPAVGAPVGDFVDFYVDNFSRIPLHATAFVVQWVIMLVLLVAVVRTACRRLDLAAIVAITLAGAATVVYVVAEGVGAWPALAFDMTAGRVRGNLDAGVAQALILSRDGLHATAAALWGAETRFRHAARAKYSWMSPPSTSRRPISSRSGVDRRTPGAFRTMGPLAPDELAVPKQRLRLHHERCPPLLREHAGHRG